MINLSMLLTFTSIEVLYRCDRVSRVERRRWTSISQIEAHQPISHVIPNLSKEILLYVLLETGFYGGIFLPTRCKTNYVNMRLF